MLVAPLALAGVLAVPADAELRLPEAWWSWPLQLATGVAAMVALLMVWRRRYRAAQVAAIAQVALIVGAGDWRARPTWWRPRWRSEALRRRRRLSGSWFLPSSPAP